MLRLLALSLSIFISITSNAIVPVPVFSLSNERDGSYIGTLEIPDLSISVRCYNSNKQDVVDADDSAVLFKYGDTYLCGDHYNQDFRNLPKVEVGTLAYLVTPEHTYKFICTEVTTGHNYQSSIVDSEYNDLYSNRNAGGITCYTCVSGSFGEDVHLAMFVPVD